MNRNVVLFVLFVAAMLVLQACGGGGDRTPPPGGVAPEAPSNLTASPSMGEVTLRWQDNSANETGFEIEQRQNNGAFIKIG